MKTTGNLPETVSREEWLAARKELLAKEKELTRARDRVNADRRRLSPFRYCLACEPLERRDELTFCASRVRVSETTRSVNSVSRTSVDLFIALPFRRSRGRCGLSR
jgi:hypothetical protein